MKRTVVTTCLLTLSALPLVLQAQTTVREHELQEVTVYAMRSPIPLKRVAGKIELIQAQQIQSRGVTSLTTLLKNQSAVDVMEYPGFLSNIGIRGFAPDVSRSRYVSLLINGIPAGTSNLSTIGLADIEQVEVLKGPFSSVYGTNAMGGVVNIVTRKSTGRLRGGLGFSVGSFSAGRSTFNLGGSLSSKLNFDLNMAYDAQGESYTIGRKYLLSKSDVERAILDPTTKGVKMPLSNYAAFTGGLRLGYNFNQNWSLQFNENVFIGSGLPSGGTVWGVYGQSKKDLNRFHSSMELKGVMGNHLLTATPYYAIEKNENYSSIAETAKVDYVGDTRSWGLVLQDEISLGKHKLVVGLDSKNVNTKSERYDATTGQPIVLYQPNYDMNSLGLFVQSNWQLLDDKLTLSAGARADLTKLSLSENAELKSEAKSENFSIINPNLGVKYEITEGLTARASVGTAFVAPDAYQKAGRYATSYAITKGNPELLPEHSLSFDAGIAYVNPNKGLYADLTYFQTKHTDMVVRTSAPAENKIPVTTYENANKGRMSGLELMLSYDFGSLAAYRYSLKAYINATLMLNAKVLNKGQSEWQDMDGVRKQNINFGLEYKYKSIELGLRARYIGERQERNLFGSYASVRPELKALTQAAYPELAKQGRMLIPHAMTFDASAHYHITRQLSVGLNLNNLLNEHYAERDGYHMPGRNFRFSASYRF